MHRDPQDPFNNYNLQTSRQTNFNDCAFQLFWFVFINRLNSIYFACTEIILFRVDTITCSNLNQDNFHIKFINFGIYMEKINGEYGNSFIGLGKGEFYQPVGGITK